MIMKRMTMTAVLGLILIVASMPAFAGQKAKANINEPKASDVLAAPQYPGSISGNGSGTEPTVTSNAFYRYFTNDPLDKIKAFYEQKTGRPATSEGHGGAKACRDVAYTIDGKKYTMNGCVFILDSNHGEGPFDELKEGFESPAPGMSSSIDTEYRAACQKYAYLADQFFPMKDDTSKPVAKSLYDRIVEPVNKKVDAAASKPEKGKKEQKTASSSKSRAKDDKTKKQKSNETAEKIKQLNKEGRTSEAMALTMQMMQEQQGMPSAEIAEGEQDEDDRVGLERTRADEKHKAYIQFLQELAKEASFKRQIIIEYKNTAPTGGG